MSVQPITAFHDVDGRLHYTSELAFLHGGNGVSNLSVTGQHDDTLPDVYLYHHDSKGPLRAPNGSLYIVGRFQTAQELQMMRSQLDAQTSSECFLYAMPILPIIVVAAVLNLAYRIAKLVVNVAEFALFAVTLSKFNLDIWPIFKNTSSGVYCENRKQPYNFTARLTDIGKDVLRIVTFPFSLLAVEATLVYGIFRPYEGVKAHCWIHNAAFGYIDGGLMRILAMQNMLDKGAVDFKAMTECQTAAHSRKFFEIEIR